MISSGQWTYVLIKMLINSNSHKENQIIQQLTTLILCNLSFLLFQTIQYAQFFCLKSQKIPINSYFQVLCAVIAHYTTAVSVIIKVKKSRPEESSLPTVGYPIYSLIRSHHLQSMVLRGSKLTYTYYLLRNS